MTIDGWCDCLLNKTIFYVFHWLCGRTSIKVEVIGFGMVQLYKQRIEDYNSLYRRLFTPHHHLHSHLSMFCAYL